MDDDVKRMLAVLHDGAKTAQEIDAVANLTPKQRDTLLQRMKRNRLAVLLKGAEDTRKKWNLTTLGTIEANRLAKEQKQ